MIYEFTISTATTYSSTNKLKTTLQLEKGIIQEMFINFPPGSAGLLYLQICRAASQVFPKGKNYFHGDNLFIPLTGINFPLLGEPCELYAFTWNDSTKFSHAVDIIINIAKTGIFIE